MDLSVIIVNYNVKHYVEQCLNSLLWAGRDLDMEVIVIDNDSHDGSVEYLTERFAGRDVQIIASAENLGFSKANNVAIRQSTGDYVLLLNPDTVVTREAICDTLAFMKSHPQAGALGVRMLTAEGKSAPESRRGLPTPMTSFYKMCGLCSRFPNHPRFGRYYMSGIPWDTPQRIDVVSGAFCLLRRAALEKVHLLDEDYFMYGEDIELSWRLLEADYENWYYPATILHYKGESTYKSSFRYVHVFYKAMLIFFQKHYRHYTFLLTLPIKLAIIGRALGVGLRVMCNNWLEMLGLNDRERRTDTHYIFIGTRYAITECSKIARRRGLTIDYYEGTIGSLPEGHLALEIARPAKHGSKTVVIYDTSAYSHSDIFRIFAQQPMSGVGIGMYDNNTKTIVTNQKCFQ